MTKTKCSWDGDRYHYDFIECNFKKGWAQLDTEQDFSGYGNWINPEELKLMSYCEGDETLTKCDNKEEFVKEVIKTMDWHKEVEGPAKIDPLGEPIKQKLIDMGLDKYFHNSYQKEM